MIRSTWRLLPVLALVFTACGGQGDDEGGLSDPLLAYGPCSDNPDCGLGSGLGIMSGGADGFSCVCSVACDTDTSCPTSPDWGIAPECRSSDLGSRCVLPCDGSVPCPGDATCRSGECVWVED